MKRHGIPFGLLVVWIVVLLAGCGTGTSAKREPTGSLGSALELSPPAQADAPTSPPPEADSSAPVEPDTVIVEQQPAPPSSAPATPEPAPVPVPVSDTRTGGGFTVTLTADRSTVEAGGTVNLRLDVAGSREGAYFPSGQEFDLKIYDGSGNAVWVWSADKGFLMVVVPLDGEVARSYGASWQAASLAGGRFRIDGIFCVAETPTPTVFVEVVE